MQTANCKLLTELNRTGRSHLTNCNDIVSISDKFVDACKKQLHSLTICGAMSSSIRLGCLRSLPCYAQNGCPPTHLKSHTHTPTQTAAHIYIQQHWAVCCITFTTAETFLAAMYGHVVYMQICKRVWAPNCAGKQSWWRHKIFWATILALCAACMWAELHLWAAAYPRIQQIHTQRRRRHCASLARRCRPTPIFASTKSMYVCVCFF